VIERASVVGRVRMECRGGALAPETRAELSAYVRPLLDKELIRPEFAEAGTEDAFRFAHQLIRATRPTRRSRKRSAPTSTNGSRTG
jgi:hypothetical protein